MTNEEYVKCLQNLRVEEYETLNDVWNTLNPDTPRESPRTSSTPANPVVVLQ